MEISPLRHKISPFRGGLSQPFRALSKPSEAVTAALFSNGLCSFQIQQAHYIIFWKFDNKCSRDVCRCFLTNIPFNKRIMKPWAILRSERITIKEGKPLPVSFLALPGRMRCQYFQIPLGRAVICSKIIKAQVKNWSNTKSSASLFSTHFLH